jgi:hypothetical protein
MAPIFIILGHTVEYDRYRLSWSGKKFVAGSLEARSSGVVSALRMLLLEYGRLPTISILRPT